MYNYTYNYTYTCLYLFILRSVCYISCCPHGDQILRSSPHQVNKDRHAWTMETPPWKLQPLEELQQSQTVTLQLTGSQPVLLSSPSWGSWTDLSRCTKFSCHLSGALSDENAALSVVWRALADPLSLEYDFTSSCAPSPTCWRLSMLALFSLHIFCRTRYGCSLVAIPHRTVHEILLLNSELSAATDHNEDLGLNEETRSKNL